MQSLNKENLENGLVQNVDSDENGLNILEIKPEVKQEPNNLNTVATTPIVAEKENTITATISEDSGITTIEKIENPEQLENSIKKLSSLSIYFSTRRILFRECAERINDCLNECQYLVKMGRKHSFRKVKHYTLKRERQRLRE
jgi:hypothetical protein